MIVRFQVDPASPNALTPERTNETAKVVMRIEQPWYNHNGGQIEFGPDGYLYIGSGDGGWEGDPYEAGQDLSTRLGKLLRIDVDVEDPAPYAIPADNPLATAAKERLMVLFGITEEQFSKIRTRALPEIFAYGLRNPYEFSFDRQDRRHLHRRRRPEPLGGDRLDCGRQPGRRELRLAADGRRPLPTDDRVPTSKCGSSASCRSPNIRTRSPTPVPRSWTRTGAARSRASAWPTIWATPASISPATGARVGCSGPPGTAANGRSRNCSRPTCSSPPAAMTRTATSWP